MGEILKKHWVVAMLLSSLPESYNSFITALKSRPECDQSEKENQSEEKALRIGNTPAESMVTPVDKSIIITVI